MSSLAGSSTQQLSSTRRTGQRRPVTDNHAEFNIRAILREGRASISEAFYFESPEAALAQLTRLSLMLAPLVADGTLLVSAAWDPLQQCTENLGLVARFGQDAVQEAIAFGPRLHAVKTRRPA